MEADSMDIPFDFRCDVPDWNAIIARWAADQELRITMSGTLKKYPGCRHWHFKRPETAGTLELTIQPTACKAWFSIRRGRSVGWDESHVRGLIPGLRKFMSGDESAPRHPPAARQSGGWKQKG
jgi:hypothetical protein